MKKTLFISDLDGTLLSSDAKISRFTKDNLNRLIKKGLYFTVATARSLRSTINVIKDIDLNYPILILNGAMIYDVKNDTAKNIEEISKQTTLHILKESNKLDLYGRIYTYSNKDNMPKVEERVFSELSSDLDGNIVHLGFIDRFEKLSILKQKLHEIDGIYLAFYPDIYSNGNWQLEIHGENASKYNSVMWLKERYAFDKIIGFGDNINDMPLFKACDLKIAVENSVNELKLNADIVIGPNSEDSVVKTIMELYEK